MSTVLVNVDRLVYHHGALRVDRTVDWEGGGNYTHYAENRQEG
jgi:hypothetical protein